jgi:hypothetical protein
VLEEQVELETAQQTLKTLLALLGEIQFSEQFLEMHLILGYMLVVVELAHLQTERVVQQMDAT